MPLTIELSPHVLEEGIERSAVTGWMLCEERLVRVADLVQDRAISLHQRFDMAARKLALVWVFQLRGDAWKVERVGRQHVHELREFDVAPDFHCFASLAALLFLRR